MKRVRDCLGKAIDLIPTPFYVFDFDGAKANLAAFRQAWIERFPHFRFAYSYKTNSLRSLTVGLIREAGGAAEVVSGAELTWAIDDGFRPSDIFFDGPIKSDEEIRLALKLGANIQIDSITELHAIISILKEFESNSRFSFRMAADYHGIKKSRFGLLPAELEEGIRLLNESKLTLSGLHIHVGSNVNSYQTYLNGLAEYKGIIKNAYRSSKRRTNGLFWIDIGGGYPARSAKENVDLVPIVVFSEKISKFLKDDLGFDLNEVELITEPGRCLVEDYGYLVTKVMVEKCRNGERMLVVDAGGNFVRSSQSWYHPVRFLKDFENSDDVATIYGANCFESDVICKSMPVLKNQSYAGALVIVGSAGGYDIPSTNVWTRPLPAIYGIINGRIAMVRRPQTYQEMRDYQIVWGEKHGLAW